MVIMVGFNHHLFIFRAPHFEEDSFSFLFTIEKKLLKVKTNVNPF